MSRSRDFKRRLPRSKGLYAKSRERLAHSFDAWDKLSPFEKRVKRRQMGVPASLYKYRTIPPALDSLGRRRFEDLLLNNELWLGTASSFNDPFEGSVDYVVPYRGADLRQAEVRKYRELGYIDAHARRMVDSDDIANPLRIAARSREASARVLDTIGICALGTNPSSPLLWAHYADSHRGVCVQLRPGLDLRALLASPVEYTDRYPVATDMFEPAERRSLLPFLRKSKDWDYEKEWRIIAQDEPNTTRRFDPAAMSGIILGMRVPEDQKAYVLRLMDERRRRFGVRPVVYQAEASLHKYRIVMRRLA